MYKMWALVLNPREAGQQSNETILLDQGWMGDMLGPGLRWIKKHKKPHEYVYDFSAAHFKKVMGAAAVRAGVGMLQVHPCQIRHSGPSHDVAQASRSLMEIKLRGRWKADASMRRYTKWGRLGEQLARLDGPTLKRAVSATRTLNRLLATPPAN